MSDETNNADSAGDNGGNGAAQQPAGPPSVRLVAHYIRDLSFENVAAQEGAQPGGQPEISVHVNLDASAVSDTSAPLSSSGP